jgi:type I restriction enzyme, S subunit
MNATEELSLRHGWEWRTVREVGDVKLGRQRSPAHHRGPHMRPYLRVANVYEDYIDTSDIAEMNFSPKEFETYRLKPGDILLNEGQSLDLVGRPAMYRGEIPGACFQNTLVRFRSGPAVLPAFALLVFRAYLHTQRFQKIARWTTNIAHLGAERFASLPFPVPPLAEQRRIVEALEEHLPALDAAVIALRRAEANTRRFCETVTARGVLGELGRTQDSVPPDRCSEYLFANWVFLREASPRASGGVQPIPCARCPIYESQTFSAATSISRR